MSEAWSDLGGLVRHVPQIPGHRHRFDTRSGYCGCGYRDDGELAEGSPEWLRQLHRSTQQKATHEETR